MKIYCGTKGLVKSLMALSICLGMIISVCVPARARVAQRLTRDHTSVSQLQTGKISSATAAATTLGVLLQWRSSLDPNNLGFNVYRLQTGVRLRVNREIIPGAAFVANQRTRPSDSYSYSWFDRGATADAIYYIEAISIQGIAQLDERAIAVTPKTNARSEQTLGTMSVSLEEPATIDAGSPSSQRSYPTAESATPLVINGPLENQWAIAAKPGLKISIKKEGWYRVTQQAMSGAGFNPTVDIRNLRLFADGQEVAISTSQAIGPFGSGDYIEFYGRGIDVPTSDQRLYYLIGDSVAGKRMRGELHVDAASSPLPAPSSVTSQLFMSRPLWFGFVWTFLNLPAVPISDASRVKRPSLLEKTSDSERATTVATTDATPSNAVIPQRIQALAFPISESLNRSTGTEQLPLPEPFSTRLAKKKIARKKAKKSKRTNRKYNHAATTNAIAPITFDYTVEQRERFIYLTSKTNGDQENFFGRVIFSAVNPATQTINVPNAASSADGPARLEIALQGANAVAHAVTIQLNDVVIGSLNYFGLDHSVQVFDVPLSQLQSGSSTLKIFSASSDQSLVDYARIPYPHAFRADAGALRFNLRGTQSLKVDGFATANVRLVDYTDPLAVTISKPETETTSLGYAITVPPSSPRSKAQRLLYASPEEQFEQPESLTLNQPSTLNLAANAADFLIIAHKNIIPALAPLVSARQGQGLTVSTVDVEDVYDEFSYGLHGPQAIKEFLSLASTKWTTPPRYVIFAGDASYDPRNYNGFGNFDLVPTKLVDATYSETAADDWLADFDDDGIADIPVGRLPVRTVSDAGLVIGKIVNFSPANVPQNALLVADDPGTPAQWDFETATDEVQALLPASMPVQRVDVRTEPSVAQATANIMNGLNQGRAVVNYSGHGNVDVWSGASVFTAANATALTNGNKLPFVIVMDCLNGYFHDPRLLSLSEAFLLAPNGGAVAAFASSGLTTTAGQRQMELQLYASLYGSQPIAVGDAIKIAKAASTDIDVRRTWIYFGDPSLKIR